jgi:hypothetical protein
MLRSEIDTSKRNEAIQRYVGIRREVSRGQVLQESKPEVTAVSRLMLEHTLSMEKDS